MKNNKTEAVKMNKNVKQIEVRSYTLPASWASYLINGDATGLGVEEEGRIDNFLASQRLDYAVSCTEEARFSRQNDAHTGLADDVLDYSFLVEAAE
jgi:hypothetical protein